MNLIYVEQEKKTTLTPHAFRMMLTIAERAALYDAAKTDTLCQVFLDDLALAPEVVLTDQWVRDGLERMVAMEIIGEDRRAEILSA